MRIVQLACVSLAALALSGAVSAQPRCNNGNANYGYNNPNYYPAQCGQPYYGANYRVGNVYQNGYAQGFQNGYNNANCNNNRNVGWNNNNGRWNNGGWNNGNYYYGNNNGRRSNRYTRCR